VASQSPSPVSIIEQSSSGSTLSCLTIRSLVQWGKSVFFVNIFFQEGIIIIESKQKLEESKQIK